MYFKLKCVSHHIHIDVIRHRHFFMPTMLHVNTAYTCEVRQLRQKKNALARKFRGAYLTVSLYPLLDFE